MYSAVSASYRFSILTLVAIGLPLIVKIAISALRRWLVRRLTIIEDLPFLGQARTLRDGLKGRAVICGGSISGLLSARICADHFEEVVIVEPEGWLLSTEAMKPDTMAYLHEKNIQNKRARIPQWRIVHGFYPIVFLLLDRIFPALHEELVGSGGKVIPWAATILKAGRALPWKLDPIMNTIPFSRENMEALIRRLVLKQPNVKQVSGRVSGCVGDSARITDIKIRTAAEEDVTLAASLVVDCTGIAHGGFHWLQDMYGPATKEARQIASLKQTFQHKFGSTACYLPLTSSMMDEMAAKGVPDLRENCFEYIYLPDPNVDPRSLVLWVLDGNIMAIACSCFGMQPDISDVDDIRKFFRSLVVEKPLPQFMYTFLDIFEASGIPFSKYSIRCPHPTYVRYANAKTLPSNFVGIGDAVMFFNPIRGQGTAKASVDVITLNKLLMQVKTPVLPSGFSKRFFKLQAARTGPTWDLYKCEDYVYSSTIPVTGENKAVAGRWLRKYLDYYWAIALEDLDAATTFVHAMCWTAPMTDLFAPRVLAKILWKFLFNFKF